MSTYARYSGLGPSSGGGGGGGGGVTTLNTETGDIVIAPGTGISVVDSPQTITISNTGALDAFTIVQTDTGTAPTATTGNSTLTLHNPDSRVPFNGNSVTNTVTLDTTGLQASGNYITALTGDVSATGPGSVPATLATVNASPGTFTYATVTVNGKGLVTSASSGAAPTGTVTSVAFSDGSITPIYTITGSPITTSGTITETLTTQAAHAVFAGPTSGAAAQPTFRALLASDIPTLPYLVSINGDTTAAQVIAAGTGISVATSTGTTTITNTSPASSLTFADSLVNSGGTVTLVNDSAAPTASQYYGTNGSSTLGYYNLPGSSGANTSLSNLSAVAINASLLPGTTNSINLGSAADTWASAYIGTELFTPLIQALGSTGAALVIKGGTAATNGAGGQVTVEGANGDGTSTGGNGGNVTLQGGNANGTNNNTGGAVNINGGQSVESGVGGTVTIQCGTGGTGSGTAGATGGTVNIDGGTGGAGSATSGNGGGATLKGGSGGNGVAGGQGGTAQLTGGTGGTGSASGGNGGAANLQGGGPGSFAGSAGGTVTVAAGNGTGTGNGGAGGSVTINTGTAGGDNTANQTGGSFTLSVGHSMGSAGGAQVQMTAGTGGVGTGSTGAGGGNFNINGGAGGVGSATGGGGGNVIIEAGQGGNSGTPGAGGFIQFQTASTTSLTEKMRILATGGVNIVNGPLNITTAGNGLAISHGSNCKLGTATLAAGTVTVSNTTITANSLVFLTVQNLGTVSIPSAVACTSKVNGTSFTITSSAVTDTSTVAWMIVEQL